MGLIDLIDADVIGQATLPVDFAACNAYAGGLDAARALRCPALFILGLQDVMTAPKSAQPLIDACADASVVKVDSSGHALMTERPDDVLAALRRFAARVFATAPAG